MNKFESPGCLDYGLVAGKIQNMLEKIRKGSLLEQADAWMCETHYTIDRLNVKRLSGVKLSMDACYINLAIVKQPGSNAAHPKGAPKKRNSLPQSSPFSLSARLKIDTPDKNTEVNLRTLFKSRKGPDGESIKPRRILIRGRAGVGKTTLCKKIVHDFTHDRWKDLFDRIVWIPLRNLKGWRPSEYNLEELFYHEYFYSEYKKGRVLAHEMWRAVEERKGRGTLFVLDGLDEVARDLQSDSNLTRLLETLLNQPNVIITSRPYGTLPFDLRPLDLELETIGFYPGQVQEYIEKVLSDDQQKVKDIKLFLENRPLIQGLVRIPIQLDALCFTWDESFSHNPPLHTMTAMYRAIELRLWKKDILLLGKTHDGEKVVEASIRTASRATIEAFLEDEICFLEHLAFTGLHSDKIDFGSEYLKALAKTFVPKLFLNNALPCLSFLRTADVSPEDQNFHFLHLTFQEYFAARYFVRQWTSDHDLEWLAIETRDTLQSVPLNHPHRGNAESYLKRYKYALRYDIFWRFVTGLLQVNDDEEQLCRLFLTIKDEPRDLLGPVHQRLVMHCLNEVAPSQDLLKFNEIREDLEDQLKQWVLFECRFNFNEEGRSQLAAEMEFPERILNQLLYQESDDVARIVLRSRHAMPKASLIIMTFAASCLLDRGRDSATESLKRAALNTFERYQEALPEEVNLHIAALLLHNNDDIQRAAGKALGRQTLSDEVLRLVAASLREQNRAVWRVTVEVLLQQSKLPEIILRPVVAMLKDRDGIMRRAAVELLCGQTVLPESIIRHLVILLKQWDENVRTVAVEVLIRKLALPDEVLQYVAASLKDRDEFVRIQWSATQGLSRQSVLPEHTFQGAATLLKYRDGDARSAAINVLSRQSAIPESTIQDIAVLLRNDDWRVQWAVVQILDRQSILPKNILQDMAAFLKNVDGDWHVQKTVVQALGRQSILPEEILRVLATLLSHWDADIQKAVVDVLGQQSFLPTDIFEELGAFLRDRDSDPRIQRAVVQVLGRQSVMPESVIQDVAAFLKDHKKDIQRAAIEVLGRQSALPQNVIQDVTAFLKHYNDDVRWSGLHLLRRQLDLPKAVIRDVAALLQDQKEDIRRAAMMVLDRQPGLPEDAVRQVATLLKREIKAIQGTRIVGSASLVYRGTEGGGTAHGGIVNIGDISSGNIYGGSVIVNNSLATEDLHRMVTLLKDPNEAIQNKGVEALRREENLPEDVLRDVASLLKDHSGDWRVQKAAVQALHHQSSLPEDMLRDIVVLLKDRNQGIREAVVEVMGQQLSLPEDILRRVASLLNYFDEDVQSAAIEVIGQQQFLHEEIVLQLAALLSDGDESTRVQRAVERVLGKQSNLLEGVLLAPSSMARNWDIRSAALKIIGRQQVLPEDIVPDVVELMKDRNDEVRHAAVEAFCRMPALSDETFCSSLLDMDSKAFENLYYVWLGRSFSDHLTWCVEGENSTINLPERCCNVPFEQLKRKAYGAQHFLGAPFPLDSE